MPVRIATPDDAAALAAVASAADRQGWGLASVRGSLEAPATRAFVVDDGGVVGHVIATVAADEGEIVEICVHPDARRRGLGRALLARVHATWADEGVTQAFLEVREDNVAARALYGTLGWTDAGRRRGYYADGTDAVVMTFTCR